MVGAAHGDVLALPNQIEAQPLQRTKDARLRRVDRELPHRRSDLDAGFRHEGLEQGWIHIEGLGPEGLDMEGEGGTDVAERFL